MYSEQRFNFPALTGLSVKQLDVHLKLYAGYVKHVNLVIDLLKELEKDPEKNAYAIAEVRRRLGFEFNGMRMHEYYFESLEGGGAPLNNGNLSAALDQRFGGIGTWLAEFKNVGMTRGIGWAILYRDPKTDMLMNAWVGDHELGQLVSADVIVAMDMWEHAFMVDYTPAEKTKYIDAFFANYNLSVSEKRFAAKHQ